ncbi:MAG: PA2779 family protein [Sulfurimonas sp.]|nr:PA2779 family protein [Sulfurimonas sp.]MDD3059986.1 PA2779 family protein [Sulfurimonas sp.]MDD5203110.1 PA2779 family protein [Sulfurimonas sp.]
MNFSRLLVSFFVSITLFAQVSWAQMASTEAVLSPSSMVSAKEKLFEMTSREDVAAKFVEMGVDPQIIQERIASMTDVEAAQVAYDIETLPAGADAGMSLLGAVVFVFIVLLVTDLLGLTKVFNFTKPIVNK